MKIEETKLEGVFILIPTIYEDIRGYFYESFNKIKFNELTDLDVEFVQDNQSKSNKNVIRGLHFQIPPKEQDKLVRVVKGKILDVAVDLRLNSKTYGKHVSVLLSEENNKQLFIPSGFAHGFVALEEDTVVSYKCTEFYSPEHEETLSWDDTLLNIDWTVKDPKVSAKDKTGSNFEDYISPFRIKLF